MGGGSEEGGLRVGLMDGGVKDLGVGMDLRGYGRDIARSGMLV